MSLPSAPIALITGSSTGIGLATARILSLDHGYHVILSARTSSDTSSAASSICSAGGLASSTTLDLCSDASIAALVSFIEDRFGRLDVLVNNAGILIDREPDSAAEGQGMSSRDRWRRTFETNVFGPALLSEALLPLLNRSEKPRIVFLSSIMGSIATSLDASLPWYPIDYRMYDASKAAANMVAVNFVRILGREKGRVNVVCPGLVKTRLTGYGMGAEPEVGAKRVVEVVVDEDGKIGTGTFSDVERSIPC